ncbi:MAG: hypothetical protein IJU51_07520 [Clostridia bacterium]|nr:hypothetical protein [Clostridia bacterium]
MKKPALPISVISVFLCGFVLHISYEASGHSAWSMLISTVRQSPWEIVKPFGLVFIMWSFIELSWFRPHLLRFVCARIMALIVFVTGSCTALCTFYYTGGWKRLGLIFLCLTLSELLQYVIYRSGKRTEIFFIPLIISFGTIFFAFLFCTFFPPDMPFFRAF